MVRIGILILYIVKEAFEYAVQYLNLRHMRSAAASLPREFEGKVDAPMLERMRAYETDKTRFGIITALFGNIVVIAFVFGGLLDRYCVWLTSLNLTFIISGW